MSNDLIIGGFIGIALATIVRLIFDLILRGKEE